jgi:mRNA interferase MazF
MSNSINQSRRSVRENAAVSPSHLPFRNIDIRRGDVVLVDLQGALGGEKMGKRLCLVIQNDAGNLRSPVTIIATITDRKKYRGFAMQVLVGAEEMGPVGTDSVVECGQLRTVDRNSRIHSVLSRLSPETMQRVSAGLKASLEL